MILHGFFLFVATACATEPHSVEPHEFYLFRDPIVRLEMLYANEPGKPFLDNRIDRDEHYGRWLERFQRVLRDHPDSPEAARAQARIADLLFELGRLEEALQMYEQLLVGDHSKPQREKLLYQLAELRITLAVGENEPGRALRAIRGYSQECKLTSQSVGQITFWMRRVATLQSEVLGNHEAAGETYLNAFDMLEGLPLSERDRFWQNHAGESLLGAAQAFARANEPTRALYAIRGLEYLTWQVNRMGGHTVRLLAAAEGRPALAEYCKYAEGWLDRYPGDEGVPDVMAALSRSYEELGDSAGAILWGERFLEYAEDPRFREARDGLVSTVINQLHNLYQTTAQDEKQVSLHQRRAQWERK